MHINWVDCAVILMVFISTLIGFLRGFVKEILALIVWVVSFFIGFKFCEPFSHYLAPYISSNSLCTAVAFAILFCSTFILGSILTYLITHLIAGNGLKGPDRVLGMIFGFARGVLVVAILLLLFTVGLTEKSSWQQESYLAPKFDNIVNWLRTFLPNKPETHEEPPGASNISSEQQGSHPASKLDNWLQTFLPNKPKTQEQEEPKPEPVQ